MAATAIDPQSHASPHDEDCNMRITSAGPALVERIVILGHRI